ncbi:MAG: aldose epimerase family protein [Kiritimatiellia bacterium]|jgi:aldose 1-epimerase|nr:aldose epimerase family protein [Kiritimatiellia bacterium]MDP6847334.1 aldose epimerase family protein [Kiritimatiellia bacterium]
MKKNRKLTTAVMLVMTIAMAGILAGCSSIPQFGGTIEVAPYGKLADGSEVEIYTLTNGHGLEAKIITYGGIVTSLKVPDRDGKLGDIVLGYDKLDDYVRNNPYFGCLVGRYGNRIAKGKFSIDGKEYTLATNNDANALHGGLKGFDKAVWKARPAKTGNGPSLELIYLSKDGEEGYPGNLSVKAVYTLTNKNGLRLDFEARTDKPTVCNLTHHSYFNLANAGKSTILDHEVTIEADKFTPVDEGLIPTGKTPLVKGTPFDFSTPHTIGERIGVENQQLKYGAGYDHNWVLRNQDGDLALAATVVEPKTGRIMQVLSTEPGLQFYTGNFLDGSNVGKSGTVYNHRAAFCMEPQHYPDSPNHPEFPTTLLKPGQTYKNTIIYRFSAK